MKLNELNPKSFLFETDSFVCRSNNTNDKLELAVRLYKTGKYTVEEIAEKLYCGSNLESAAFKCFVGRVRKHIYSI